MTHCFLIDVECDCFIVWYLKQKYYAEPHKCSKCNQVKMLVYNDNVCKTCYDIEIQDLLAKVEQMGQDNPEGLMTIEEIEKEKQEYFYAVCLMTFVIMIDIVVFLTSPKLFLQILLIIGLGALIYSFNS